ncbi:glycoside hydrolase family 115 protein [Moniliophthora roreri MCA 2997]|uniref:Glycoside hydrolase family 115 protein n=1 Tax=Moniliophthora roreri (strain MCA 2997) TaxID=1381753 RepID=V2XHU5_MONRO|nr:glycoside hydrolase family 115 protein [Moniliophthora roreri MCA 2997]
MARARSTTLAAFVVALLPIYAHAIGQAGCVTFESSNSSFPIISNGQAAPILLSADDWPGVHRTALDFAADIERVSGVKPQLLNATSSDVTNSTRPIIVGTLGRSSLIDAVVNATNLDVSSVAGSWETFLTREVTNPLPGVESAYVIIGSDKRGTIYAMYDHSEQFGVSPWYWWADVPVTKHDEIFARPSGCSQGPPTIQYRGIFLNDEQPALQNWAMEKFTNGTGSLHFNSPFNHFFYANLFELMLRLKANYLWPAMWGSAFNIDDPINQPQADFFGIVMGTSHQEPMMRGTPNEWSVFGSGPWDYTKNKEAIYEFWVGGIERAKPYESIITLGMRGLGDLPVSDTENIPLVEGVINDQQQILEDVYNGTDIADIPKIWTLYKEVEGYYTDGLKVEDHVTLLWSDDNWGNVHRYPTLDERSRRGGAGIYYHVDYVGDPRDYKWIISSQIPKMYEQLSLAVDRNATRLWILNVGDLKPYERETEFFITLGWNSSVWNPDNLHEYVFSWAQREFDVNEDDAASITDIVTNLTRFNSRRKPELLNSTTFSLAHYREAETVISAWDKLANASTAIYDKLSDDYKPAFFQLVHHPVLASQNLGKMYIFAGMNNLRAEQARLSANGLADQVEELFEKDFDIETQYHSILDGKWDHMMDQTHIGYAYWQQPMTNSMPMITRTQTRKQALAGVMRIVPEGTLGAWPGDNVHQCDAGYDCPPPSVTLDPFDPIPNRYVDVGAGGPAPFDFTVTSNVTWLQLSDTSGTISPDSPEKRIFISVPDWSQLAAGINVGQVDFVAQPSNLTVTVNIIAKNTREQLPSSFKGFVESGGVVSIEAAHASRNTSVDGLTWRNIPGLGRTLSGVTPWPRGGKDANYTAGSGPSIEYDFFNFNDGNMTVTVHISPSLNANGRDRPLAFAAQLDSAQLQSSYYMPFGKPGTEPDAWNGINGFVANSIVSPKLLWQNVTAGAHTLKLFMIEPAVVVQKIVIDTGGLQTSYLGPPESISV